MFSGIEAATVAWRPLGWVCVAVAEIEKFPCALLAHHYPDVSNLGNIKKITEEQIKSLGHIDVVVMGFPCQDLSIAGKRKGLKNEDGTITRSGLFYTACRIAEWSGARFVVGENVPGLFSSNKRRDFASVVGKLAGANFGVPESGWRNSGFISGQKGLVEWCVLDAQYFNLAQRRQRVFIVRDSGDWTSRPPLLLDAQSLQGNPSPSRETRKDIAPTIGCRAKGGGGFGTDAECDGAVIAIQERAVSENLNCGPAGKGYQFETGFTLEARSKTQAIAFPERLNGTQCATAEEISPSLGNLNPTAVAFGVDGSGLGFAVRSNASHSGDKGDGGINTTMVCDAAPCVAIQETGGARLSKALNAGGMGRLDTETETFLPINLGGFFNYGARRLTPIECERLMGFPDNYTLIPLHNKRAKDGPRYRAIGNSFPVPVMAWIGRQIEMILKYQQQPK